MPKFYVVGFKKLKIRTALAFESVRKNTHEGMHVAAGELALRMDSDSPKVPIDTRAMRNSWYIKGKELKTRLDVEAGYTVEYAPVVHENVTAKQWTEPGSGPKWLQIHFNNSLMKMETTIREHAQIKG